METKYLYSFQNHARFWYTRTLIVLLGKSYRTDSEPLTNKSQHANGFFSLSMYRNSFIVALYYNLQQK